MKVVELLSVLINSSEKAARIARLCRRNEQLFSLLIEEKTGEDKNERFFRDFKTLADVLIQESIKSDVARLSLRLSKSVRGEESNKFENALGEKVVIVIESEKQTKEMLLTVLDQNEPAAQALAAEIHKTVEIEEYKNISCIGLEEVEEEDIGIWIDPIDGTQEYIAGDEQHTEYSHIQKSGLKCATVLIGAYQKSTGSPFLGVINQPFAELSGEEYKSEIFYGISLNGVNLTNVPSVNGGETEDRLAIISSSEAFVTKKFKTVAAAGAGYKALKVIQQHAAIYYLSKGSTYKWDTCAVHGILKSLGGDIVELSSSVEFQKPIPLKYGEGEELSNQHGIIAFINFEDYERLIEEIRSSQY